MKEFLWLIPFLPLAGFLFISLTGKIIGSKMSVITAVSMTGLSAVLAIII
jgi:NADH:ubiquinone oxidoreductase subunit 5 (subunit L)/multisubunit Na+/H+ antiporter MnhA subunit